MLFAENFITEYKPCIMFILPVILCILFGYYVIYFTISILPTNSISRFVIDINDYNFNVDLPRNDSDSKINESIKLLKIEDCNESFYSIRDSLNNSFADSTLNTTNTYIAEIDDNDLICDTNNTVIELDEKELRKKLIIRKMIVGKNGDLVYRRRNIQDE